MSSPLDLIRGPAVVGLALLAACSSDLTLPEDEGETPDPVPTVTLTVQAGDGQDGVVGEPLGTPLVVRVTSDGEPLPGRGVVFEIQAGDGSVSPDTAVTDPAGQAMAQWTLGQAPGEQVAAARMIAGTGTVTFTAHAVVGEPSSVEMVSGNGQHGAAFEPLPQPLVVRVTDRFGNAVAGVTVNWEVASGRGTLDAEAVATDGDGFAQVTWTLGFSLGTQRVRAEVDGVDAGPVEFEADIF